MLHSAVVVLLSMLGESPDRDDLGERGEQLIGEPWLAANVFTPRPRLKLSNGPQHGAEALA